VLRDQAKKAMAANEVKGYKELRLLIKGDVSGTVEAVEGALSGIGNKEAGVKIVQTGVGEVSSGDVEYAEAVDAIIIGFNVACSRSVQRHAADAKVELHLESVIYRLIETVRAKTAALLPPKIESRVIGEATVLQLFQINLKKKDMMTIAGCRVNNGLINKTDKVRVMRGPERRIVYEGSIETLRHLKKDVSEIRKGMECGIGIQDFDGIKEGDEIVTYETFEVARTL